MTFYPLFKFRNTKVVPSLSPASQFNTSSFIFTSTWRSHPTPPVQRCVFLILLGHNFPLLFTSLYNSINFNWFSLCFLFSLCSVSTKIYSGLKLQSTRVSTFLTSFFLFNFIPIFLFSLFAHHFQLQVLLERLHVTQTLRFMEKLTRLFSFGNFLLSDTLTHSQFILLQNKQTVTWIIIFWIQIATLKISILILQ